MTDKLPSNFDACERTPAPGRSARGCFRLSAAARHGPKSRLCDGHQDVSPVPSFKGKGKLTSPVIAGDGTIYIAGGGAQVSAVKPTGETLWTIATETWPDHLSLSGDHTIWVTGQEGAVYGLCDPR